jgi:filamentous hemagglutinin family protein
MSRSVMPSHHSHLSFWKVIQALKISRWCSSKLGKSINLCLLILPLIAALDIEQAQAQPIVPAPDGTGSIVTPDGNRLDITGGQLSGDKANLFHSFTQFGLNPEQIANFISNPAIQNILGRVVGGDPSVIHGLIQVTGGNSNLFLMNPAGIVFSSTARLDLPGAFTATTANGIGFGSNWFSASGLNNYATLVGNPDAFNFSMSEPGAILNAGNLTVGEGQNLTLLGGTIASTGSLSAPEGQIIVTAVPGEKLVRLSQPGSPLSLEIQPIPPNGSQAQAWNLPIVSLPQLLTAGGGSHANKLTVNSDGNIQIHGSGIPVVNGDVVTQNVTSQTATLSANRNLTLVESQLRTTGNLNLLAQDTVQVRDSVTNPFVADAGGNLLIQGNQGIDILALNHPETPFKSGGNLSLVSDGIISGDSHFASGGSFSILNFAGNRGEFVSLYDPIIRSNGDVTFGDYTGASLKVEAVGNISANDITITAPEISDPIEGVGIPTSDPDFTTLTTGRALILRAGLDSVDSPSTFPTVEEGTTFSSSAPPSPAGSITVGNINTSGLGTSGSVILDARGDIATNVITSNLGNDNNKGDVSITSRLGAISINNTDNNGNSVVGRSITINTPGTLFVGGDLNARSDGSADAGDVTIGNTIAPSSITVGAISTRNLGNGNSPGGGGNINVTTTGSFNATGAFSRSTGEVDNPTAANTASIASEANGSGGRITITADGGITTASAIVSNSRSFGDGGDIILTSNSSNITIGDIDSSGRSGGRVSLNAGGEISFNSINSQGIGFDSGDDATPSEPTGIGGDVSISANGITNGVIRGTGTIADSSIPPNTTILTQGSSQSGSVTIQHNGGVDNSPFTVGNSTTNGTAGAINAGNNSVISPSQPFPVLANGGNASDTPTGITIASVNAPPTLTANSQFRGAQVNQPFTIRYADLNPNVNDVNGDNTVVRIDAITTGTLRKNGTEVVPGTPQAILSVNDTLEYTPAPETIDNPNAFVISASDGVSSSAPPISINVEVETPEQPDFVDPRSPSPQPPSPQPPSLPLNPTRPSVLDPYVLGIDNKFANEFESYLKLSKDDKKPPITLERTRDILLQIEKATGVKPAVIYVSFTPYGGGEKLLQAPQAQDQLDLVVVTPKGEPIRKSISLAKRAQVLEVAKEFAYAVNDPLNVTNNDYLKPAQQLYQWIVAPLETELKARGINNLLFITDEGLRSIPLAALHDGEKFLVENYSVGFSPSLSLTDTRYNDIRNSQVLAMGASRFEKLKPLPAVPLELSIIAQDIWNGKFFLNQAFTLNNLRLLHRSEPYGIIHLATHGRFEQGAPENSYIQLWNNPLQLTEFESLGFNQPLVELLVLSACETALGNREAELGFGGAAAKAGVKTVLASLWQVSDAGTLGLMIEFYRQLKTAPIKAEALRQAQIAMLQGNIRIESGELRTSLRGVTIPPESPDAAQKRTLSHPYYWAAFTMIGNPW